MKLDDEVNRTVTFTINYNRYFRKQPLGNSNHHY